MRTLALTIALVAAPAFASAQQHQHAAGHAPAAAPTAEGMKTKCPLHLTTLNLTPAQDSAFKAIRAEHMASMKATHEKLMPGMKHPSTGSGQAAAEMKHDSATHAQHMAQLSPEVKQQAHAAMKAGMQKAAAAARAVLTAEQLPAFEAAAKECEAKCEECCEKGCGEHGKAAHGAKHEHE